MMPIRISSTLLDSFRLMLTKEYISEAEVVGRVKGEPEERSWQALGGIAWHEILEGGGMPTFLMDDKNEEFPLLEAHGFTFPLADVEQARMYIGPGTWEVKYLLPFDVEGNKVDVVCKLDHLRGNLIQDNKTKWGDLDVSSYDDSLQWRLYLLASGAKVFRYNLWDMEKAVTKRPWCQAHACYTVRHYPYPDLAAECRSWVINFIDWCRARGLVDFLRRPGGASAQ